MKRNDNTIPTVDEVLLSASNYIISSTKSVQLDNDVHRKLKRVLVDYDTRHASIQKLVNTILCQWIQSHKIELHKKMISKIGCEY
jgi:DNA recombination-dependent growth factor C